jgi:hypothetical protein
MVCLNWRRKRGGGINPLFDLWLTASIASFGDFIGLNSQIEL